jgi:molybdate transport system ATP-binding protein
MKLDLDIRKTLRSGQRRFQLNVSFRSTASRIVVFGPSGAGKSMLLKAIAGLIKPDEGHIQLGNDMLFDARAGISLAPQQRRLAYLFQEYALFPHLSVRQNIAFGLVGGWRNPSASIRSEAVEYWIDAFRLSHVAHQHPAELSGGQKQRTALARALVASPRAILLDEPFAALDPELRREMRTELDELQRRLGVPMILITHDPEDARVFGDETIRMQEGSILPSPSIVQPMGLAG